MKIRLLLWPALALSAVSLLAACATGGTFANIRAERDQLVTLDTTLAAAGKLPSADVIAPDAQLVGFPYSVPADTVTPERCDTLVGSHDISSWLAMWHARQLPDVDFVMKATGLKGCDGVAIQEGEYSIKGPTVGALVEHQSYRAVRIQQSDSTWMLYRLWLKPDNQAYYRGPVTGCRQFNSLSWAMHRRVVEADVLYGGKPAAGQVADAMQEAGWTVGQSGGFPSTSGGIGFAVGFLYRLTPVWGVEGLVLQDPIDRAHGSVMTGLQTMPWKPTLGETERRLGLLGTFTFGPARLSAGPALTMVEFDWTEQYSSISGFKPVSATRMRIGGVAQLTLVAPIDLDSPLRPEFTARYSFATKVQVPEFIGLEPLDVSMGRFMFGLGLAYSF